jgi:SpoVK/Ycf46/Vps4 family AAA+-type ATPase
MTPEKEPGYIAYKYHDLKVYASTEWLADGKKKYRQVFEASETGYIYSELSFYNKQFDEKDWTVKVNLKCFEVDAHNVRTKELCSIEVNRDVKSTDNMVYIREGWGNATPGQFWKKGRHVWVAFLDDVQVGERKFYIEAHGPVTAEKNPYFNVTGLRLFEGPTSVPPASSRKYYMKYDQADTRYVWGELKIANAFKEEAWVCEVVFNFYNDARQLKGRTEEVIFVAAGQESFEVCSGWGSDTKGTWYNDRYTLEVVFMENLVSVVSFEVGAGYLEGETQPMLQVPGTILQPGMIEQPTEKNLEELMAELNALIGLGSIKKKIGDYTQYLRFLKIRQEKGIEDPQKINLHAVLTGNPGTGKTTVAKMLGKIYHKMGLLSKGHVHEVDRAELVGEYIGQTAPKVKEAIKKAAGGILFIDEAYALARNKEDYKDYGREVVEILIKEMSDGAAGIAVIVAGYPDEMRTFLDSNPGLKSRFNMNYDFPDYLPQELMEIARYSAQQRKVNFNDDAFSFLYEKLVEAYRTRDRSFGNARYVNSLIDEAKMNMGLRIVQTVDLNTVTDEELSLVRIEDVKKVFGVAEKTLADIPIDEDLLHKSLAELNGLIGMNVVKAEIQELVKLVKFYREIGKDVMNTFSLHSVFTGNPGTGKTTVARILAKIFKALGILEKGHIVEVDRADIVGGYVGQTAILTSQKLDEAKGGVFFIDEAYALSSGGQNDFGKEAVETILKRMEDDRGQFIVIAAGYPDNMRQFLEMNPGLKSRFDKAFHFEDYNAMDLWDICSQMLAKNEIAPDHEAELHLKQYFAHRYQLKDKFFGNARTVRKVVEEAVKNQHLRLASLPPEARNSTVLKTMTLDDVREFDSKKEDLIETKGTRIGFGANKGASGGQSASIGTEEGKKDSTEHP